MSNLFHDDHYTVSELTKKLASKLTDAGLRLTTAESCTGESSRSRCAQKRTPPIFMMSGWWCSAMKQKRGSSACVLKRWRAIPPSANRRWARWPPVSAIWPRRISALPSADTQALKGATMGRRQGRSALAGIFAARRKPGPFFSPVTVRTWWKKRCILRWLNW